jgi:hypothetical protein
VNVVRVTICIPVETVQAIDARASELGLSRSACIVRMLEGEEDPVGGAALRAWRPKKPAVSPTREVRVCPWCQARYETTDRAQIYCTARCASRDEAHKVVSRQARQIADLQAQGVGLEQIAERLGISVRVAKRRIAEARTRGLLPAP